MPVDTAAAAGIGPEDALGYERVMGGHREDGTIVMILAMRDSRCHGMQFFYADARVGEACIR